MAKEPKKGDHAKIRGKRRRRCQQCCCMRYDVKRRPDAYSQEMNESHGAEWTVCDHCDHENRMDI